MITKKLNEIENKPKKTKLVPHFEVPGQVLEKEKFRIKKIGSDSS